MQNPWPFDQPPNCAVISLRSIMQGGNPVLYVVHDPEDDGWQFLSGGQVDMADAMVVALESVIEMDATLLELSDLPSGWRAYRESIGAAWTREQFAGEEA